MTTCPNCKKPVSGRVCGYCGASLVENFFSAGTQATEQYPTVGVGNLTATIVGLMGGLALLAAAIFNTINMFMPSNAGGISPTFDWWLRLLVMVFCGALFFVQQMVLRGLRFSVIFDCCWLFIFTFSLGLSMFELLYVGTFAILTLIPWLGIIGYVLCIISCIISLSVYKKP